MEWDCRPHRKCVDLIGRLSGSLNKAGWKTLNDPQLGVACLQPPEGCQAVDRYRDAVNCSHNFWLSTTEFEGKKVLRACVTNGRTSEGDIDNLVETLLKVSLDELD